MMFASDISPIAFLRRDAPPDQTCDLPKLYDFASDPDGGRQRERSEIRNIQGSREPTWRSESRGERPGVSL